MKSYSTKLLAIAVCGIFVSVVQAGSSPAISASVKITAQEAEILSLTNKERKKAGLKPLRISKRLTEVARDQSSIMAHKRQLSHSVGGKGLDVRIKKSGYPFRQLAENIAQSGRSAPSVMNMWMKSPGHRVNILNRNLKDIGIGVVTAPNGDKYYTQVFGAQN
jgi:uncharacterized protein YkwD